MDNFEAVGQPANIRNLDRRLAVLCYLAAATRDWVWMTGKNWIKLLLGSQTNFDECGLFLRQYLLHLTGLRHIRKITCVGHKGEGPGSQALMMMNAISFASSSGLTYVHTPFTVIKHADRPMREWAAAWETLLNLGGGELVCEDKKREVISYSHNCMALELCFGWNGRRDELNRHFSAMIPQFRSKYYLNKSPRMNKEVIVAVHSRRGFDVSPEHYLWTITAPILRTIAAVSSRLDIHKIPYKISIFSEGDAADFAEFRLPGLELLKYRVGRYADAARAESGESIDSTAQSLIDIDAPAAMQELIEADILIMSKSSFCYYAALISDGIKIAEPETDAVTGWLLRSEDGSFNEAAFERQVCSLHQFKRV